MNLKLPNGRMASLSQRDFIEIRPRLGRQSRPYNSASAGCDLVIFVARDYSRVLIGGGEFGYDGLVREADSLEIEALAERFPLDDLRRASEKRRA